MMHIKNVVSDLIAAWADHFPPAQPHYTEWLNIHLRTPDDTEAIESYNNHLCALIAASASFITALHEEAEAAMSGETLTKDDGRSNHMYRQLTQAADDYTYDELVEHLAAYFATHEDIHHSGLWNNFTGAIKFHYDHL